VADRDAGGATRWLLVRGKPTDQLPGPGRQLNAVAAAGGVAQQRRQRVPGQLSAGDTARQEAVRTKGFRVKLLYQHRLRDTKEIVEIAKAADELGYDGVGIPDHVVNLETLATPLPVYQGRRTPLAAVHAMARSVGTASARWLR